VTGGDVRDRISSVCADSPFHWTQSQTPFSFDLQPSGQIDEVFRVELEAGSAIGGFNYTEERIDSIHVWVAKKHAPDISETYRTLLNSASSLRAAVIRDGSAVSETYSIPNAGIVLQIQREAGKEFAVVRQTVPVCYEVEG
jgi:hypothetical protein